MGDTGSGLTLSSSVDSPSYTVEARVVRFRQELRNNQINLTNVSRLAYEGIPDKYGLRPLIWKVSMGCSTFQSPNQHNSSYTDALIITLQLLLKYLPVNTASWPQLMKGKHQDYAAFCEVSIINH